MTQFQEMTKTQLEEEKSKMTQSYSQLQAKGLKLNMARGKPGADQLELSLPMLDVLSSKSDCRTESGIDCRNYGELPASPRPGPFLPNTWVSPRSRSLWWVPPP